MRFEDDPLGASFTLGLDYLAFVHVEAQPGSIDALLAEQERLFLEYDYRVPDPWYEELDLTDTDRSVHFLWYSPSGDSLIDTVLLQIGDAVVSINYNRHIDSFKRPPSSDEFLDVLLDSLHIDRPVLERTLGAR